MIRRNEERQTIAEKAGTPLLLLEELPSNILSNIVCQLDIESIHKLSQTCTKIYNEISGNDESWKLKFHQRWNYFQNTFDSGKLEWRKWYKQMYMEPNDLWCFYENITWPDDSCYCNGKAGIMNLNSQEECRAFQSFHDDLKVSQYDISNREPSPQCTDVLFFPLHNLKYAEYTESHRLLSLSEELSLFFEANLQSSAQQKLSSLQVTYHSWFWLKLINPQYIKSIQFKIYIQEPSLFTVFPSEGILQSGQEMNIVFGVQNCCSWLTFLQKNIVSRPICIQYWFIPIVPCVQVVTPPSQAQDEKKLILRNISLRAHVHPYYTLDELHAHVLFEQKKSFYMAPLLQYNYPFWYHQLPDLSKQECYRLYRERKEYCIAQIQTEREEMKHWMVCFDQVSEYMQKVKAQEEQDRMYYIFYKLYQSFSTLSIRHFALQEEESLKIQAYYEKLHENVRILSNTLRKTSNSPWYFAPSKFVSAPNNNLMTLQNDVNNACFTLLIKNILKDVHEVFFSPHSLYYVYDSIEYPGSIIRHVNFQSTNSLKCYLYQIPHDGQQYTSLLTSQRMTNYISIHRKNQHSNKVILPITPNCPLTLMTTSTITQESFFDFMASHFGWNNAENPLQVQVQVQQQSEPKSKIIVDRRLLLSLQYLANFLFIFPLFFIALARALQWIHVQPFHYSFIEDSSYESNSDQHRHILRYLTTAECQVIIILLIILWCFMTRYCERFIGRTVELEFSEESTKKPFFYYDIIWDRFCPLLLQEIIYKPFSKTETKVKNSIIKERNNDLWEYSRYQIHADNIYNNLNIGKPLREASQKNNSKSKLIQKLVRFVKHINCFLQAILLSFTSFMISSPFFLSNLWIVFHISISLGLSVSIQSVDMMMVQQHNEQHQQLTTSTVDHSLLYKISNLKLHVFINLFFLLGQLIGSSGGSIFLAEFIVTSVSLFLGGAATISTNAIESWMCFLSLCSICIITFCLSRVGLLYILKYKRLTSNDNTRRGGRNNRQIGILVIFIWFVLIFFVLGTVWISFVGKESWELPTNIMIDRKLIGFKKERTWRSFFFRNNATNSNRKKSGATVIGTEKQTLLSFIPS